MVQVSPTVWKVSVPVMGLQPPEVTGCYSIRFVVNHSPRNQLKFNVFESDVGEDLQWALEQTKDGSGLHNINFKSKVSQVIIFEVDIQDMSLKLTPSAGLDTIEVITTFSSYQLNGFVWDSLNMFEKFDPRIKGRDFERKSDILWTIDVPLLKNLYKLLIQGSSLDTDFRKV